MADSSVLIWVLFAIPACAAALAYLYWPQPLTRFGVQDVQRVLRFEPEDRRAAILQRGTLTRWQWQLMLWRQSQAIDAELKRRGEE